MAAQPSTPVVVLNGDTITLPAEIASRFQSQERFVVLTQGDMLLLKRISVASPVDLADATPAQAPPLSLDEIDDLVHEVRVERRGRAAE